MAQRGSPSRGIPGVNEMAAIIDAPKVIGANLAWRAYGRAWTLDATVSAPSTGSILRLVGNVGRRNHSFSLLYNNTSLKRFCTNPYHRNPDRVRIDGPHKHSYEREDPDLHWAYVPTDIRFGDINVEFRDFLAECNISLEGEYQEWTP